MIDKEKLLDFIRSSGNSTNEIYDTLGIIVFNRLTVGFSHSQEHKCRKHFADNFNVLCPYALENEIC